VPSARAARRVGSITLDGVLDDSAWAAATPITEFTQVDPDEGRPGSERTEFRILYDDDALYVGARLYDSQGAAGVRTRLVRRDEDFGSDNIEIVIDGFHDHLGRAFFDLNPSGSKSDFLGIGTSCCDSGWDPIWEAATRIDSLGWSAEMRIRSISCAMATRPCKRGACSCAASSIAAMNCSSGRSGAKQSPADRIALATSKDSS
jgi:hypothetical protein